MSTSMTRQHFKVIAEVIKKADVTDDQRKALARDMASEMWQFNSHFDRARFILACGVTE